MTLRLLTSLSLLLISWQTVRAQSAPADDFFHNGAQSYLSNNIPQAKEMVESGLKIYPNDEKLKKLEALLNQQQQSQSSQSKQNQQQQQQQNSQTQPKPDDQKQNQSGQKKDEQQKPPEQKPSGEGQMTPEEAKKLLDAQKGDEQLLPLKPQEKPQDNQKPVKDW